jgi:hypothetical protein
MKKLILSIITITVAFFAVAQNTKRPGYVAQSSVYKFDQSKTNMPMQGYYILKDGTEVEAIIAYRKPEFFVGDFAAGASLLIGKELTGKPMDPFNPDSEPNFKEFIDKNELKAFFIDGHMYANIEKVGWRIVLTEGAIHDFIKVVKVTRNGKDSYVVFKRKQWFQDEPIGSALSTISQEDHLAMIEKTPPTVAMGKTPEAIVADYKANKIPLYEAEVQYNIWFNENSEMQIDYILGENGLTQKGGDDEAKIQAEKDKFEADKKKNDDHLNAQNEANQNAEKAKEQDPFKGRTMTIDPSVASAKPELKVKREKFAARIKRIKADGNKVGVVVLCSNTEVNPKSHKIFSNQKAQFVRGSYKPIEGIESIGITAVEEFNNGFGTDVFELVDMKKIPYKDNDKGEKEDNWWPTKYKLIIFYTYNPYYVAYVQTTGESPNEKAEFKGQMFVKSFVYMETPLEGETKMKTVGKPPKSVAYFSEPYLGDASTKVYMIQELKALVNPLEDDKIMEHLLKYQSEENARFIKKNSK